MFYFLLLMGGGFILLGLKKRQKERNPDRMEFLTVDADKPHKPVDSSGLDELNKRIDHLQKLLFESLLVKEENRLGENRKVWEEKALSFEDQISEPERSEKPVVIEDYKEVIMPNTKPMPENIKAILEYESKGLSVQEIANQTHMNKGEVLLLQNLAKHYAK